jgi:hypothetical protein
MATNAERQKAYRTRKKAGGDPSRLFLQGIVDDTAKAIEAGTADAAMVRNSRKAIDILGLFKSARSKSWPRTPMDGSLDHDPVARQAWVNDQEREFQLWLTRPGNARRASQMSTAAFEQAELALKWANAQRVSGEAKANDIVQGLDAAKFLVTERHRPQVEAARTEWATHENLWDMMALYAPPARKERTS